MQIFLDFFKNFCLNAYHINVVDVAINAKKDVECLVDAALKLAQFLPGEPQLLCWGRPTIPFVTFRHGARCCSHSDVAEVPAEVWDVADLAGDVADDAEVERGGEDVAERAALAVD